MTVKNNTPSIVRAVAENAREDDGAKANRRRPVNSRKPSKSDTDSFLADLDDYLQATDNLSRFTISPKHYRG